jgi:ATP-dependent helicase/nuclease subunit A
MTGSRDDPGAEASRQQYLAADPLASVFVTANAGSGKTKVLIDRIARLLLSGAPPSSFLCITYTKAAAAEMQRRLFARLGEWCVARDDDLEKDLAALIGDAAAARQNMTRARALFARALETPGGLKIQTIHAFCERLLARFPLEAHVAPGFEIADEMTADALIGAAWADVFTFGEAEVVAALERFSLRLDQGALSDLFARLVAERARLKRLLAERGDLRTSARALRARFGPVRTASAIHDAFLDQTLWKDVQCAAEALAQSSANDKKAAAKLFEAQAERAVEPYFSVFLTDKGEPRSKPVTDSVRSNNAFLDRFVLDEMNRVISAVRDAKAAERGCDAEAAALLGGALIDAYGRRKADRGVLDFEDLIGCARALLENPSAAPWVLFKLDRGIDHILIDEGQDTSPDQWSLLLPFQDEFFAGEGAREETRTVFAVGDPKQSIYSFQGADPARFQGEAQALALRAASANALYRAPELTTSFRSAPEVLQAVDAVFSSIEMAGDPPELFNRVRHSAWRNQAKGVVEWWPLCPRPERMAAQAWDAPQDLEPEDSAPARLSATIASTICDWIAAGSALHESDGKMRPIRPGDVLILVRQRGPLFRQLLKACKRAGLPVAGADRLVLGDEIAVQDALTLVRVALDPYDDLALACLIKGPWGGLTDDDTHLSKLAIDRGEHSLWARLQASDDPDLVRVHHFVTELIARRDKAPFEFLSLALEAVNEAGLSGWRRVMERLGAEARDPLEELLSRAMGASKAGRCDLQSFLAGVEADDTPLKREMEAEGDAVRIMTVHGAKGLEAPVVFLPDTAGPAKLGADSGLLIDAKELAFSASEKDDDELVQDMRARLKERLLGEHWRLLYVAMTRARDRLIVCGHGRGNSMEAAADSWHKQVGDAIGRLASIEKTPTPFGEGLRLGEMPLIASASGTTRETLPISLPEWTQRAARAGPARAARPSHRFEGAVASPRIGIERFARGKLIHGLLQRLPEITAGDRLGAARLWLERQGVTGARAEALALEALTVIEDKRFAAAFATDSRAETAIVGQVGGASVRGVIDRLAISATDVLIVDFKTDRPPPSTAAETPAAYVRQLALYQAVIKQALPGRQVTCALVFTHAPRLIAIPEPQLLAALADGS